MEKKMYFSQMKLIMKLRQDVKALKQDVAKLAGTTDPA